MTFHSPPRAADQLIAVTEGGVLVNSAAARPIYSPSSHELGWSSDLERLGVRAPDGTLSSRWKGPSSVTYPSASAHGFPAAIVEYLYGGRALTLVRDDGTVDRLVVSGERRLSEPRINPGGNRIAYVNTPCKGCRRELAVRTVGDDAITWQLTGDQYLKMGTFRWLDDDHLLLFARLLGEDEVYSLWSVDVTKGTRKGLIEITGAQRVADPAVHPKGTHVAVAHQNEGAVVVYERASGETTAYPVGGRARALTYHPDGRRIAFELDAGGRTEIALLDVSSKKVTELTHNQREDRFPHFSPDGTRLYFEARAPDPALPRREVMRVASVAVP